MKSPDTHFGSIIPSTHCQPLSWVGSGYTGFAIWIVNSLQMFSQTVSAWRQCT
jgi:hypothetical protein